MAWYIEFFLKKEKNNGSLFLFLPLWSRPERSLGEIRDGIPFAQLWSCSLSQKREASGWKAEYAFRARRISSGRPVPAIDTPRTKLSDTPVLWNLWSACWRRYDHCGQVRTPQPCRAVALEAPDAGRGQKPTHVSAGSQKRKALQSARGRPVGTGSDIQIGVPYDCPITGKNRFSRREAGPRGSAVGSRVLSVPGWKDSPSRSGAQQAPGPRGAGQGLFHFKVKICRLWETIFKKVYNLHMPLNGGSS